MYGSGAGCFQRFFADGIASLSGILLNEDYYRLLLKGRAIISGLSVLRPEYLILFKAKAFLDLKAKRNAGNEVHASEFKKHKKDILRIITEMEVEKIDDLPSSVLEDITEFVSRLDQEPFDVNTLKNYGVTTEEVADRLSAVFL